MTCPGQELAVRVISVLVARLHHEFELRTGKKGVIVKHRSRERQ